MPAFTARFDTAALDNWVDDMQADVQQALRPAAQAGAQVLYEAVLRNVPTGSTGHWFHGTSFKTTGQKYRFEAGTLRSAVYQAHSKDNSALDRQTYHISWNHKKAPYGFMVEYGTKNGAKPVAFVRRAAAQHPAALQAVQDRFFAQLKTFA
jgi:hypothetical protein